MITLRNFERKDYGLLISWIPDSEFLMQFAGPALSYPLTINQIAETLSDTNRNAYAIVNDRTLETIGYGEVYITGGVAFLGRLIIGKKQNRGKGYGLAMVEALVKHSFLNWKVNRSELNVFDWNIGARKCYEKAGFVINPVKKGERKINGKTWFFINMGISREEWIKRSQRLEKPV
ncbi:MAG: GNAT family protein [Flavitalea sp.]